MNIINEYLASKNLAVADPEELRKILSDELSIPVEKLFVLGEISNRLIVVEHSKNQIECFPIAENTIDDSFISSHKNNIICINKEETSYILTLVDYEKFVDMLERPQVKLISLYHQENFPLPRFALGISDIAAAIRRQYIGKVTLCDMQFNKSISDVTYEIGKEKPNIIGVSATFGQHDLIEDLIKAIQAIPNYNPLIVLGGSLSALNTNRLLKTYPSSLVAKGYGETTMQDIVRFWLGIISINQINFIAYYENDKIVVTDKNDNDKNTYINPELDLLEKTLSFKGVLQLESSRGCTYHCSFCPRAHKGNWSGETGVELKKIMPYISNIFEKYPAMLKKIFLVDEEFIGYKFQKEGVQNRALQVAALFKSYDFKFESSTRIDQVYRPSKQDSDWQIERIDFWKTLVNLGLDRMLFGVESGVDSILKRFNKNSTAEQNAIAIRILTTIGVPLRLTYIVFDPLMTIEELIASYKFLGRRDILLKKNNDMEAKEIVESVFNDDFINQQSLAKPLYSKISYMLVSMESLLGSPYLKLVEEAGLAEEYIYLMGKRKAKYKNENIGLMSYYSQLWIDRNFALDYLLKSIIKISRSEIIESISILREKLKYYSYSLLGKMLSIVTGDIKNYSLEAEFDTKVMQKMILKYVSIEDKNIIFIELIESHFQLLKTDFIENFSQLNQSIEESSRKLIEIQIENWSKKNDWQLINDN